MDALSYGWTEPEKKFWLKFNMCSRAPNTWKQELYASARDIANSAKKPVWLCISGGLESEIMLRAFFDQGIHFSALTLRHMQGTNEYDVSRALKMCRERGITLNVLPIDMKKFLNEDANKYIQQSYTASSVFRLFQIKLLETVEELGGFAVIASGRQLYIVDRAAKNPTRENVHLEFWSGYAAPLEWCKRNHATHEPYLFFHSPELCLSYIRMPFIASILNNPNILKHRTNARTVRRLAYDAIWDNIQLVRTYNGHREHLLDIKAKEKELDEKLNNVMQIIQLPVTEFESQLSGGRY